jgi:hypothetical protein
VRNTRQGQSLLDGPAGNGLECIGESRRTRAQRMGFRQSLAAGQGFQVVYLLPEGEKSLEVSSSLCKQFFWHLLFWL